MDIQAMGGVSNVSRYPLIEYMVFDTDISDGSTKMREATILGEIVYLHQYTKNWLKYVHTKSKYGHLVAITDSDIHVLFPRSTRDKGWFDGILLHS